MDGSVQIPFEAKGGGLIIRFANREIVDQKTAVFTAIARLIKEHQARAALVDLRAVPGGTTFLDRYELGEAAARFLPRIDLAVLMNEEQLDRGQIGIMVAANRGIRIELFTDPAAAERWFTTQAQAKPVS